LGVCGCLCRRARCLFKAAHCFDRGHTAAEAAEIGGDSGKGEAGVTGGNSGDFFRRKAVPVVACLGYQKNVRHIGEGQGGCQQSFVRNIEHIGTEGGGRVRERQNVRKPRLDKALFYRGQFLGKGGHVAVRYRANAVVCQKADKAGLAQRKFDNDRKFDRF
jgi:hypothetical protein